MITIILAGGLGERMKIDYPKSILKVKNIPMIVRSINTAILSRSETIIIILNEKTKKQVISTIKKYVKNTNIFYIIQKEPLGKLDAILCCKPLLEELDPFEKILILNCNQPLISFYTLNNFLKWKLTKDVNCLSCKFNDPSGFPRLLRDKRYNFQKIKEEKECNNEELKIKFVDTGIYLFRNYTLLKNLTQRNNLIDLINNQEVDVYILENKYQDEFKPINEIKELRNINEKFNL